MFGIIYNHDIDEESKPQDNCMSRKQLWPHSILRY